MKTKRLFLLFALVLSASLLYSGTGLRTGSGEEFSFVSFNHNSFNPEYTNGFGTNSITSALTLDVDVYSTFNRNFGLAGGISIGYEHPVLDAERFATVPSSFFVKGSMGPYFEFGNSSILLAGGLRTSYMYNRSLFISQLGGELRYSHYLTPSISLSLFAHYWKNTNFRTIGGGFSLSYEGGRK